MGELVSLINALPPSRLRIRYFCLLPSPFDRLRAGEQTRSIMPSLISGYEYDIFISYRHKDNKSDGWVTEFVRTLRSELEATFKEDISIYFDENPHDGLLQHHEVDDSLKEKLRCLILIPIVSQTYCDPKAFAWQHELIAFIKLASEDKLGLKTKVGGGNTASRVLPVRIHEVEPRDKKLFEEATGGVMRPIDFIKSPV